MTLSSNSPTYRPILRIGPATEVGTLLGEDLRGVAVDGEGRIYAAVDSAVKVFDPDGTPIREWPTSRPAHAVAVDADGSVWVGGLRRVEVFDADGTARETWDHDDGLGLVTAIGLTADDVFLADASARWIHRYDREGKRRNQIGDRHRKGGFHIPNGVVDFAIDAEGVIHVANPGMHRVERYAADGTLLSWFGRFDGQDPAGFPGCCNPTNLTVDAAGRVIVTEKAGPRAKIYDRDGELVCVVATDIFDPAAKNMDVAVDRTGRILVADTARSEIVVFEAVGAEEIAP
jgi:sugar lactone lactonase YvrE